jgi:hypothetical protein
MSASDEHDIGDVVELEGKFTDVAGAPANPGAVALRIRKPDGTVLTPTPTSSVVGTWSHTFSVDLSGWWNFRFIGTGANAAAEEGRFFVRNPIVPLS